MSYYANNAYERSKPPSYPSYSQQPYPSSGYPQQSLSLSPYPQQPYSTSPYAQPQYITPQYTQQQYPASTHIQQPSPYQPNNDLYPPSSVDMGRLISNSSSGSSGYDYPSPNATTPSDGDYEIDVQLAVAPSSKNKGRKESPKSRSASHSDVKPFHCLERDCNFRTKREYDLNRHMKNHFPPAPEEMFPCPGKNCHRVGQHAFKRKDHMMEHVANYHDGYINGKKVVVIKKKGAK